MNVDFWSTHNLWTWKSRNLSLQYAARHDQRLLVTVDWSSGCDTVWYWCPSSTLLTRRHGLDNILVSEAALCVKHCLLHVCGYQTWCHCHLDKEPFQTFLIFCWAWLQLSLCSLFLARFSSTQEPSSSQRILISFSLESCLYTRGGGTCVKGVWNYWKAHRPREIAAPECDSACICKDNTILWRRDTANNHARWQQFRYTGNTIPKWLLIKKEIYRIKTQKYASVCSLFSFRSQEDRRESTPVPAAEGFDLTDKYPVKTFFTLIDRNTNAAMCELQTLDAGHPQAYYVQYIYPILRHTN